MKRYNPYISAFQAAAAELSSADAQAYYLSRAAGDIDRCLTAYQYTVQFCQFVIALGAQLREWCDELEYNARAPQPQLALAGSTPIAFLPDRSSFEPKPIRVARAQVQPENGVIVPAAPSIEVTEHEIVEQIQASVEKIAESDRKLSAKKRQHLKSLTVAKLRREAAKAGHTGLSRMTKQELLDLLCPPMPASQMYGDTVQSGGRALSIS